MRISCNSKQVVLVKTRRRSSLENIDRFASLEKRARSILIFQRGYMYSIYMENVKGNRRIFWYASRSYVGGIHRRKL